MCFEEEGGAGGEGEGVHLHCTPFDDDELTHNNAWRVVSCRAGQPIVRDHTLLVKARLRAHCVLALLFSDEHGPRCIRVGRSRSVSVNVKVNVTDQG